MLRAEPIVPYHESSGESFGHDDSDSIDTEAIVRFIRRRWRVGLIWLFAGLCAGVAYTLLTPAHYAAFASVLLQDDVRQPSAPVLNGTEAAHSTYIDTQVQILQSDEVVGRLVDRKRLTEDAELGKMRGGLRVLIRSLFGFAPNAVDLEPRHATIVNVRRALSVRRIGMSDVAEIGFISRYPARSAEIVNGIIQSYVERRLSLEQDAREATAAHLREHLAELRVKAFPLDSPDDAATTAEAGREARAHFRELQVRIEAYRTLYDRFLQRIYGDAGEQSASSGILVITPAEPPVSPSSRTILLVAFASVGAVTGVGHALLKELMDHRLSSVEDVQRLASLNYVVSIPKIQNQDWIAGECLPRYLQPAYLFVSSRIYGVMGKMAATLQEGQVRRSGWITGVAAPTDGAGVSSLAVHLARVVAESGQKTLLVDANWRKPTTGQALLNSSQGCKLARGLVSIDLGDEKVDVLVLRATTPMSELNASLSIGSALAVMRTEYDCLVVDFHSSEQTADLRAGMTVVDEVILVTEAGRTTSDRLSRLLREIPRGKIAAVILNKLSVRDGYDRNP